jgi:hypothetical protein
VGEDVADRPPGEQAGPADVGVGQGLERVSQAGVGKLHVVADRNLHRTGTLAEIAGIRRLLCSLERVAVSP